MNAEKLIQRIVAMKEAYRSAGPLENDLEDAKAASFVSALDWVLTLTGHANDAVRAVGDLRRDYDEACEELHGANGYAKRAEAAEARAHDFWIQRNDAIAAQNMADQLRGWNERVSVCRQHVDQIVDGGCVICQADAALASAAGEAASS